MKGTSESSPLQSMTMGEKLSEQIEHRPIPVLHFSNALLRGGAEEHILTLLRGLDRQLFRLHLVCPPTLADALQGDLPPDVELITLSLRTPTQLGTLYRLGRILRERRVEILHSHLFYASLFASPIGRWCRVPVILETPHLREQWRHSGWKSRFVVDRWVGHFVDYYIAVSQANARYLVEDKRLPQEKIKVIHNGCDLRRFDPARPASPGLKARMAFAENDPVLAVVGRLEPQKGHRVLLEALPAVRHAFPRTRLVCVGEGSLGGVLAEEARALGLADAVRFVGYQSNVADWLALADAVILPSFYEGLPLVAIEALAAGRPVVATAVDGTPEVIIDGQTGLTVPPGDPARLAESICQLLREPELGRRLAEAGRRWVLAHFTQERQVQETQAFYLSVWRERRGEKASGRQRVRTTLPEQALASPAEEQAHYSARVP